jgi:hypothetical protein
MLNIQHFTFDISILLLAIALIIHTIAEVWMPAYQKAPPDWWLFTIREIAKTAIAEWIEAFYNRKRLHSTIGYVPPVTFEENYWANQPSLT